LEHIGKDKHELIRKKKKAVFGRVRERGKKRKKLLADRMGRKETQRITRKRGKKKKAHRLIICSKEGGKRKKGKVKAFLSKETGEFPRPTLN